MNDQAKIFHDAYRRDHQLNEPPPPVTQPVSNRDLQTMDFQDALDAYTPNLIDALPEHIPLARFKRIVVTAVNLNPELRQADRRSLFNACIKAAFDGLYPDGREAALVVFNTEVTRRGNDGMERKVWVKLVQYMPMIDGIRKRMRNSGEVLSANAEVVYRNDKFRHVKGESPYIEHEPCALTDDPGDPVGAYAIIKLANGEVLRDVMSIKDIERSRSVSRAKNSLMWTKFWDEGAKKTVLRRCGKGAPGSSELHTLLARDEEVPETPDDIALPPPRPRPEQFPVLTGDLQAPTPATASATFVKAAEAEPEPAPPAEPDPEPEPEAVPEPAPVTYTLIDCDGEHWDDVAEEVQAHAIEILAEAARRSPKAVGAFFENNQDQLGQFQDAGGDIDLLREAIKRLRDAAARSPQTRPDAHAGSTNESRQRRHRANKVEMEERRRAAAQQHNPAGRPPERASGPARPSPASAPARDPHPMPAEGDEPEPKPSRDMKPVDEAGNSSEPEAGPGRSGGTPAPDHVLAWDTENQVWQDYVVPMYLDKNGQPAYSFWWNSRVKNRLSSVKSMDELILVIQANAENFEKLEGSARIDQKATLENLQRAFAG